MIKAITFDLDGVYFPNGKANFIKNLVALGIPEDEAKRVFLKSREMNELYKNGVWSDVEFWTWAGRRWGFRGAWQELVELLVSGYDVNPDVVSLVKAVRHHGYKTLICSNNFKARIDGLQARFKFLDDFDAYVFAYEVGASKPSEKIFQELIKRSGVEASQIVFADDNPDNLAGAQSLGITAFLYEGFDKFISHLKALGVKI